MLRREAVEWAASELWSAGQRRECEEKSWDSQGCREGGPTLRGEPPWGAEEAEESLSRREPRTRREDHGQARLILFLPLVGCVHA